MHAETNVRVYHRSCHELLQILSYPVELITFSGNFWNMNNGYEPETIPEEPGCELNYQLLVSFLSSQYTISTFGLPVDKC